MRWPSRSVWVAAALLALATRARAQDLDALVARLAGMSAVSGLEDAVAESLLAALPGSALDRAGNVVWTRGSGAPVRVALCSMDEVGYVVGAITPEGYLTLRRVGTTPVGPLFDQALEGQRVTVFGRRGPVPGVVGVRSVHLSRGRPAAPEDPFSLDNAFVDVGATSAAGAAQLGLGLLAPVTRAKHAHRYGLDLVAAPGAAARAACAALLDAARRPAEGGGSGTTIAAFTRRRHFRWDGAAYLLADRAPGSAGTDVVVLGEAGPADSLDLGAAPARRDSLPAADGWRPVVSWSLPTRYAASGVETVALRDVATLAARLARFLGDAR
jgi:putative aminopeptidase FrvX